MKCSLIVALLTAAVSSLTAVSVTESTLTSGAMVRLAAPDDWNGGLAVLAPGYKPEDYPLTPYFPLEGEPQQTLLERGWAVASTSYRRNGVIVADAVADLEDLIDWAAEQTAEAKQLLMIGGSMGGAVTVRYLEANPGASVGAMLMSNAIYMQEEGNPLEPIRHEPGVPVVLLTNINEAAVPQAFATVVGAQGGIEPVLFTVGREGHMAYNSVEYTLAIETLLDWVATGKRPETGGDLTREPDEPMSTSTFADAAATNQVIRIDPVYGNFISGFTASDLAQLGLEVGDTFELEVGGERYSVKYGTTYSDVPVGDWVAFLNENRRILFCINFGQAAKALGLDIGDALTVRAP